MQPKTMTLYALLRSGAIDRVKVAYSGEADGAIEKIVGHLDHGRSILGSGGRMMKCNAVAFYFDVPEGDRDEHKS